MANPVPGYRVTTGYKKPGGWAAGYHTGVDEAAPHGAKVVALRSGTVTHVGWGGWGNAYGVQVHIRHGHYITMVAHMSRTTVRQGQTVREGQQIGNVGTTGRSTGPHAHIETRVSPYRYNNVIVNPTQFFGASSSGGGGGHPTYLSKLKYGQRNSESVKNLQRALNAHKMPGGRNLPVTGYYGPMTDAEVRLCQRLHGFGNDPKGKSYIGPKQAVHLKLPDIRR
jgi:murein DD-endopeptidase MepM/ murein hydrolase activator NlpD